MEQLAHIAGLQNPMKLAMSWRVEAEGPPTCHERRREDMVARWGILLLGMGVLSACVVVPTGPSVPVWPAVGKPLISSRMT